MPREQLYTRTQPGAFRGKVLNVPELLHKPVTRLGLVLEMTRMYGQEPAVVKEMFSDMQTAEQMFHARYQTDKHFAKDLQTAHNHLNRRHTSTDKRTRIYFEHALYDSGTPHLQVRSPGPIPTFMLASGPLQPQTVSAWQPLSVPEPLYIVMCTHSRHC